MLFPKRWHAESFYGVGTLSSVQSCKVHGGQERGSDRIFSAPQMLISWLETSLCTGKRCRKTLISVKKQQPYSPCAWRTFPLPSRTTNLVSFHTADEGRPNYILEVRAVLVKTVGSKDDRWPEGIRPSGTYNTFQGDVCLGDEVYLAHGVGTCSYFSDEMSVARSLERYWGHKVYS
jgi:hypothetical protein